MRFYEWLADAAGRNQSLLCVGLDPRAERLVPGDDLFRFNRRIVDATADLVCAYKPNYAFYEVSGLAGLEALRRTVDYVHKVADVPVILDAKRGDIGSTAAAYARAAFEVWGADALTVNPYLGGDSVSPFTAYADRGVFLLCHTSNPGAIDLQTLPIAARERGSGPHRPLYQVVAQKADVWDTGLVVGATYPEALAQVRSLAPEAWILLPGVGAQGGDLEAALGAGLRADGLGVIVNSSRGILYADDPRRAARALRGRIEAARSGAAVQAPDPRVPLALALADIGAIRFGEFTLASGKQSPVYIDLRLLASHPQVLRQVARAYAGLLRREVGTERRGSPVRLAAIPYAAMAIGTAVSLETGLPMIYPRREVKAHGTGRVIEGEFVQGETAVVLDDLITTGGSKLAAIEPLEAAGLVVRDVVVLIDREQGGREDLAAAGYRLHAVLGLRELLEMLVQAGSISAGQRDSVAGFLWGS
jgi:uridine monophosphate synthetase